MAKKRKTVRRQAPSRAHEGEGQLRVVTTEQLEAILNVLNMLIRHADRVASKTHISVVAARDLLVSKGIVSDAEWDAAVNRVEREQATLFTLDPDVQRTVDEYSASWTRQSQTLALRRRAAKHDRRRSYAPVHRPAASPTRSVAKWSRSKSRPLGCSRSA